MKNFLLFSTTFFVLTICVHADQVITLKDGSQLHGELISVVNGVYTVQTTTMGQIQLNANNVVNVRTGNVAPTVPVLNNTAPSTASSTNSFDQKFQQTQTQLMSNPELLAEIQEMAKDPEIMKLLSDPALIQSATSHDVNGISQNPNTQELISNPKMKALMEKLQAGNSQ